MALRHWTFVYAAVGLPEQGDVRVVESPQCTTVLAGFPSVASARAAWESPDFGPVLERTQLVELCGAFSHADVVALRARYPEVPVGLVTYAGDLTARLHSLFG